MVEDIQSVLEDVTYILNELRNNKLKLLERKKLSSDEERLVEEIEKDLNVCVTKLGLLLHPTEL